MPSRVAAIVAAAALMLGACGTPADPEPTESPGPPSPATKDGPAPSQAEELATIAPIDLIVDLGPDGWRAGYGDGAGIEVTPENWAEVYNITADAASREIAAGERDGLVTAATEAWYGNPDDDDGPRLRLTIRQYESLAAVENAWWEEPLAAGSVPDGVAAVPDGIELACQEGYKTDDDGYYRGAYYADCNLTIADATHVYLSSTDPDGDAATSRAADGIAQWLETVTTQGS